MPSADPSDYGRAKYSENRDFTRGRAGSAWKIERDISGLEAKFVTRWINEIFSADQRIFRHSQSNKMEIRLVTILHTIDIANHVPNWINLLVRLITIVDAAADFRELKDNFEKASRWDDVRFYGSLFSIGASGISSVRRLEEVMDAVDGLDARKRCPLLREYCRKPRDHGLLVGASHSQEA